MTHICVGNVPIIGSDNGLSSGRRQAIIWTNAGILLIGPLGTNFSEILIEIQTFSYMKMHLKMSSAEWCPFILGLNVLKQLHYSNRTWEYVSTQWQLGNSTVQWLVQVNNNRWPVDSPHKGQVMRKAFPCYNVIMFCFVLHVIPSFVFQFVTW